MPYSFYHISHLLTLFILVGLTCASFVAPDPKYRKRFLMFAGISSLLVFVSGFGLLTKLQLGIPSWVNVKIVCWFIISLLAGLAFRKPKSVSTLWFILILCLLIAIYMVSLKPI